MKIVAGLAQDDTRDQGLGSSGKAQGSLSTRIQSTTSRLPEDSKLGCHRQTRLSFFAQEHVHESVPE
eukprot:7183428-Prorocentrum_lima.AAC.1